MQVLDCSDLLQGALRSYGPQSAGANGGLQRRRAREYTEFAQWHCLGNNSGTPLLEDVLEAREAGADRRREGLATSDQSAARRGTYLGCLPVSQVLCTRLRADVDEAAAGSERRACCAINQGQGRTDRPGRGRCEWTDGIGCDSTERLRR